MTWDWRKEPWVDDARKIPDDVMNYIRKLAVYAVEKRGVSPEEVTNVLGMNRTCIYRWINIYHEDGIDALETESAPGAMPKITREMDDWLKYVVLEKSPLDYGYDTVLWTKGILTEILKKRFKIDVSVASVGLHLRELGLTYQKPEYNATEQDSKEVKHFLEVKFPIIQRVAKKLGASILFEDESGVGIRTRYGRTWGKRGKTPKVYRSEKRGGYNILSAVSAEGKLQYSIKDKTIKSKEYIEFLKQLLRYSEHPIVLVVDRASFHTSKDTRDFVRSNRNKIRVFFLPKYSPKLNPDEQVWSEIKCNNIGKQPVKNKNDLLERLRSAMRCLQRNIERVKSFFMLENTKYAYSALCSYIR
jgi:transposase